MNDLWIQVSAGLVVALISGVIGYIVRRDFFQDVRILPIISRTSEKANYSHLGGTWHLYYVTRMPIDPDPIWIHGIQELRVNKNKVEGTTRMADHPSNELRYRVHGEIRQGRMIKTDYSLQDETEFASLIYTDLLKSDLVGIWTGFDGFNHQIAAPVVLSRNEKSVNELNQLLKTSTATLIPMSRSSTKMYVQGKVVNVEKRIDKVNKQLNLDQ
jgi:hypothetical protein